MQIDPVDPEEILDDPEVSPEDADNDTDPDTETEPYDPIADQVALHQPDVDYGAEYSARSEEQQAQLRELGDVGPIHVPEDADETIVSADDPDREHMVGRAEARVKASANFLRRRNIHLDAETAARLEELKADADAFLPEDPQGGEAPAGLRVWKAGGRYGCHPPPPLARQAALLYTGESATGRSPREPRG